MKKALITGITGQDAVYLAEFLLKQGYGVYGTYRRLSTPNFWRLKSRRVLKKIKLISLDLTDQSSMIEMFNRIKFDEVYNLAAQSFVGGSFEQPICTADVDALGPLRLLDCMRILSKNTKFYQASTSEMYGGDGDFPQDENTPFNPRSPYASAKTFAHHTVKNYREAYGLFACSGILFNHESPYRGLEFVTRKITNVVAKIKLGLQKELHLGNLDAKRDWGHAKDYVKAMYLMLNQDKPEDYVIATGETHTVREFVEVAFSCVGIKIKSNGKKGINEVYIREDNGEVVVRIDPKFFRPAEVNLLLGNPSKANKKLGWKPNITFKMLVKEMVEVDIKRWEKKPLNWDAPNATGWEECLRRTKLDR